MLYHIHWCLHVCSKRWGCVCIRASGAPHTNRSFSLIDSRIVLSRAAVSTSEWLDVSETPHPHPLPKDLALGAEGCEILFFKGSSPPYCRISTHGCRTSPSFGHPPENTHRTRFTEETKACHSYTALLGPRKKETIHCQIWLGCV